MIDLPIDSCHLPDINYFAVPTILRNGTPDSAKYLFCGTHRNGSKTASQLSGYYIEMYPKQVALIS